MKLKDIYSIWKIEFKTTEELMLKIDKLSKDEKESEILGITQFEYYSSSPLKSDGYFLWLGTKNE